jgi:transketolase
VSTATPSIAELETIARRLRGKVVELSHKAGTPHLASSLSVVDILVAAYWGVLSIDPRNPMAPDRDRFILSKGHAISALYAALAMRNFFPESELTTFAVAGSRMPEQPAPHCMPGVELATGSLGHGLPVGLGMAVAARINQTPYRVFVTVSDGECNEGSVWEAAMLAPALKLDNLVVVVDYNKWQATGRSNETMSLAPLKEKWEAFGWDAHNCDGHNIGALIKLMKKAPSGSGKPLAIVADTVKGKGVSFMQDDNNWHYRSPDEKELALAFIELGLS